MGPETRSPTLGPIQDPPKQIVMGTMLRSSRDVQPSFVGGGGRRGLAAGSSTARIAAARSASVLGTTGGRSTAAGHALCRTSARRDAARAAEASSGTQRVRCGTESGSAPGRPAPRLRVQGSRRPKARVPVFTGREWAMAAVISNAEPERDRRASEG